MINVSKFQSFIILLFLFFGLLVLNRGTLNEDLHEVINFFTFPLIVTIFIIAIYSEFYIGFTDENCTLFPASRSARNVYEIY